MRNKLVKARPNSTTAKALGFFNIHQDRGDGDERTNLECAFGLFPNRSLPFIIYAKFRRRTAIFPTNSNHSTSPESTSTSRHHLSTYFTKPNKPHQIPAATTAIPFKQ
ncbi:hypothetical protein QC763_0004550 [Podospora pseudopauciseta]|uniref:Uncharacterized protein n=2 Tax=Podospora TaxID=5144 RepID=A0ABR0HWM4_9PEZI|nr:hypothetical protein QC763_0004550 [Podospora pseudopauciseta]KAK4681003.1 hypothetical protein QC764_0004570 [Podospora pseudoanserina]